MNLQRVFVIAALVCLFSVQIALAAKSRTTQAATVYVQLDGQKNAAGNIESIVLTTFDPTTRASKEWGRYLLVSPAKESEVFARVDSKDSTSYTVTVSIKKTTGEFNWYELKFTTNGISGAKVFSVPGSYPSGRFVATVGSTVQYENGGYVNMYNKSTKVITKAKSPIGGSYSKVSSLNNALVDATSTNTVVVYKALPKTNPTNPVVLSSTAVSTSPYFALDVYRESGVLVTGNIQLPAYSQIYGVRLVTLMTTVVVYKEKSTDQFFNVAGFDLLSATVGKVAKVDARDPKTIAYDSANDRVIITARDNLKDTPVLITVGNIGTTSSAKPTVAIVNRSWSWSTQNKLVPFSLSVFNK